MRMSGNFIRGDEVSERIILSIRGDGQDSPVIWNVSEGGCIERCGLPKEHRFGGIGVSGKVISFHCEGE